MSSTPEFDIIVYGATGYTGRLVAEYLSQEYADDSGLRWAMAGRSQSKLEAVRDEINAPADTPLVVADTGDADSLRAMAERTRVVLTTGTFLNGLIHIGEKKIPAGRVGEAPAPHLDDVCKDSKHDDDPHVKIAATAVLLGHPRVPAAFARDLDLVVEGRAVRDPMAATHDALAPEPLKFPGGQASCSDAPSAATKKPPSAIVQAVRPALLA